MDTNNRIELFKEELDCIKSEVLKNFCIYMLSRADDYFFEMPASTTGKYHPAFSLGDGGLARHTKEVAFIAMHLATARGYGDDMLDAIIVAALMHDIKKKGNDGSKFTVKEHPECAVSFINDSYYSYVGMRPDRSIVDHICNAVLTHMGKWGNIPPTNDFQLTLHEADYLASRKTYSRHSSADASETVMVSSGVANMPDQQSAANSVSVSTSEIKHTIPSEQLQESNSLGDKTKAIYTQNDPDGNPGDYILQFGKWLNMTIDQVYKKNPGYIKWMAGATDFKNVEAQQNCQRYLAALGNGMAAQPTENAAPEILPVQSNIQDMINQAVSTQQPMMNVSPSELFN